jgi:hypothetical protein
MVALAFILMLLVPFPSIVAADANEVNLRPHDLPQVCCPARALAVQEIITVEIEGESFTYYPGVHSTNVVSMMGRFTVTVAAPNHPTIVNLINSIDTGWSVSVMPCSFEVSRPGVFDFTISVYAPSTTHRGANVTLTVTALAKAFGLPEQQADDHAHILVAPEYRAMIETPSDAIRCHRGSTVTINGTLTNLGNGEDVFILQIAEPQAGLRASAPVRMTVRAGGTGEFEFEIHIESDAPLRPLYAIIEVRVEGSQEGTSLTTESIQFEIESRTGGSGWTFLVVIAVVAIAFSGMAGYRAIRRRRRRALDMERSGLSKT